MSETYQPPEVWTWQPGNGGQFANINRPTSGATHEQALPVGEHPLQLYSLATPNGVKVTVMLEELLAGGHYAEYDAWPVRIGEGDQFSSGFVALNPNSKIPALLDRSGAEPVRLFESGAILLYLADKFHSLIPADPAGRAECLNWLFWQMGAGPFLGGGFGHFYAYAPEKFRYPIDRFTMEVKRQIHLLDTLLAERPFIAGEDYSIADIAIWPWYGELVRGRIYGDAARFLSAGDYRHLGRWAEQIAARPGVRRGRIVNRLTGEANEQLPERHGAADIDAVLALTVAGEPGA